MHSLIPDELTEELDPEMQAICDEVCGALQDFNPDDPGSVAYFAALEFGRKWWFALRSTGNAICRQRIIACCDAITVSSGVWITIQGQTFTQEQIETYQGRESYIVDSQTGESRRMIEWPTGRYAGGSASYEKPESW